MRYIKALIFAAFIMLLGSCKHATTHKEKAVKIHSYHVKRDKTAGPNSTPGILATSPTSPSGTDETYLYIIWSDGGISGSGVNSYRAGTSCYSYSSPVPVTDFKTANFTYGKAPELAEDEELTFDQIVNEQLDDLEASVQAAIGEDQNVIEEEVDVDNSTGQTVSEATEGSTEGSGEGSSGGTSVGTDEGSGGSNGSSEGSGSSSGGDSGGSSGGDSGGGGGDGD